MIKYISILLTTLALSGCFLTPGNDVNYVIVRYEGYTMPPNKALWIADYCDFSAKRKIMDKEAYYWSGYFRQGEKFVINVVTNNKKVQTIGLVEVKQNNLVVTCNKNLTLCKVRESND